MYYKKLDYRILVYVLPIMIMKIIFTFLKIVGVRVFKAIIFYRKSQSLFNNYYCFINLYFVSFV